MKATRKHRELPASKLRWRCPKSAFRFKTTDDIEPCTDIIGQDRALESIKLGLELEHRGYNIFITGLVGTGRTTTIKHLLERLERKNSVPPDICYMHNFRHPNMPAIIELAAGDGMRLAADMDNLVLKLREQIPAVFRTEYYQDRRKKLVEAFQAKQKKKVSSFETKIGKEGFAMVSLQVGPIIRPQLVPVVDGNAVDFGHVSQLVEEGKLPAEKLEKLKEAAERLSEEMQEVYSTLRELEKTLRQKLEKLDLDTVQPVVHDLIREIDLRYRNEHLSDVLGGAERHIMKQLDLFRKSDDDENEARQKAALAEQGVAEDPFRELRVNVIVDNTETGAPPIVIENFPNLKNIFGIIERDFTPHGWSRTDHMNIRAGSFHRANGGYLVLNALDVFIEPGVWQILKRTLKSSEAVIQSYDTWSIISTSALKPQPMSVKVKIVLIGDARLYYLLQGYDEDFRKIFKIRADFDREVDNRSGVVRQYAGFIKRLCTKENLHCFDRDGVAAIVEYGVRLAGRQNKISTRFSEVADLIREADYHAREAAARSIRREHVQRAIEGREARVNMYEEKIQERIDDGTIMIDTAGAVVGQVNALSVYDLGDYMFGKPSRITARVGLGNSGVINIEREADLSGPTHNKGVLILGGYLRGVYGAENPLVMSASLAFEQSYGGVDGDSASSTELYALLSALADLPVRQDVAVTGSINQKGEIQPIGGVNEKIEGFFKTCSARGLAGTEGVVIPAQNAPDLMLDEAVVDAVRKGRFHVWPVRSVDEGIEILTGVRAGSRLKNGRWQKGTVHDLVQARLDEMTTAWKRFGRDRKKEA
ncbi:MAG: AAA family ATPase [Candidatus Krumholzibacteriota bacterium]|nr:AAA family ATPase [Candidatus Krumholzibacteriota bacterium]